MGPTLPVHVERALPDVGFLSCWFALMLMRQLWQREFLPFLPFLPAYLLPKKTAQRKQGQDRDEVIFPYSFQVTGHRTLRR